MGDDEFNSKMEKLIERVGDDPKNFELSPDEQERIEMYIGTVIQAKGADIPGFDEDDPYLGTSEHNLQPAEWELLYILLDQQPPIHKDPES